METVSKVSYLLVQVLLTIYSEKRGGLNNGRPDPYMKASEYHVATLTLVTPSNTSVTEDLIKYATDHKVSLIQLNMEINVFNGQVRVAEWGTQLNPEAGVLELTKFSSGRAVYINWQKK